MDNLITAREFAKKLNISYRQTLALIKAKRIKYINVGVGEKPIYMILEDEFDRFLAEEYNKQQ